MDTRKAHWENVYATKQPNEVSWTQDVPKTSLELIATLNLEKSDGIIDIGGGDSKLVDFLLEAGYTNVTVLDISENAIERAKRRLGEKASRVKWIVSDVLSFRPEEGYTCWHDRATFHFLTEQKDIATYASLASAAVLKHLVIGTFSESGPTKCSALPIHQYSCDALANVFKPNFDMIQCMSMDHMTPFNTTQNFTFCRLTKE